MRIRKLDTDTYMVNIESETAWALHVNKNMPRRLQPLSTLHMLRRLEPGQPGSLAAIAGLLPAHLTFYSVTCPRNLPASEQVRNNIESPRGSLPMASAAARGGADSQPSREHRSVEWRPTVIEVCLSVTKFRIGIIEFTSSRRRARLRAAENFGELHRWLQVNGHDDRCQHMQPTDGVRRPSGLLFTKDPDCQRPPSVLELVAWRDTSQ